MKTIIKTIFAVTFLFFLSNQVHAQENYEKAWRMGIGLNAGIPTHDPYDFALGGDIRFQRDLSSKYSLTFTTGFNNLFVEGQDNDLGFIPVKIGFKAFVLKDQLYLLGETGGAFAVTNGHDDSSLILSPGIGYATKSIDLSLRYEHYTNFPKVTNNGVSDGLGQVAFRIAYGFKL